MSVQIDGCVRPHQKFSSADARQLDTRPAGKSESDTLNLDCVRHLYASFDYPNQAVFNLTVDLVVILTLGFDIHPLYINYNLDCVCHLYASF